MKAVVFCHFHDKSAEYHQGQHLAAKEEEKFIASVLPYYKAYLKCKNIGLIYVYVDTGIRQILNHIFKGEEKINIDINELAFEHTVRNILKLGVDQALGELSIEYPEFIPSAAPKFQFIGLPHLASLIASLYRMDSMDKNLIKNLAGEKSFSYDAPKFVEAVIRLARGQAPTLSSDPVLRFDQDVEVNEAAIDILLDKIQKSQKAPYSFFSGGYGQSEIHDPVNDYAVRCHWLAKIPTDPTHNKSPYDLIPNGIQFLRDIGEFGATSIPNSKNESPSPAMENYIKKQRTNRDSQQVISGAGLYMSLKAIQRLPPFMNFENNTIWVDDHLKRRLHEAVGELTVQKLEHVEESLFRQDRYPKGIQPDDLTWANETYFYRLVSGCIMHALIVDRTGEPGKLAEFVADFLDNRQKTIDAEFAKLEESFTTIAKETTQNLLKIWETAYYGNDVLQKWAIENEEAYKKGTGKLVECINLTVRDAIHYCKLIENWPAYVDAIEDLEPHDAYWLFRSVV